MEICIKRKVIHLNVENFCRNEVFSIDFLYSDRI